MANGVNVAERYKQMARDGMSEEQMLEQGNEELEQKRKADVASFGEQRAQSLGVDAATKANIKNQAIASLGQAIVVGADAMGSPGQKGQKPEAAPVQRKAGAPDNLVSGTPRPTVELANKSAVNRTEIGTKAQMQQAGLSDKEMRKFQRFSNKKGPLDPNQGEIDDLFADTEAYSKTGSLYSQSRS